MSDGRFGGGELANRLEYCVHPHMYLAVPRPSRLPFKHLTLRPLSEFVPRTLTALRVGAFFLSGLIAAHAETVELAPVFVTATRSTEPLDFVPFSHQTIPGDALRAMPNLSVDGALRSIPGFSLFRRSDSIVANPTAQGVSLRGLGPSGASRSLILLDGVPLNDPFGGWVMWSKVPRESLSGIEIVPGGGSTAWGNAALGGVIQLFTEPVSGSRERLVARGGSFQTHEVEGQVTEPIGPGTLQVLARDFSTDGFFVVAPERRGAIDTRASSRARWLTGRWRQALSDTVDATITLRRFSDDRGNGTPYQRNNSDESFGSVALSGHRAEFQWNGAAYVQGQNFASTFSSVNASRTAETPASDQFAVPSTAIGLGWVGNWTAHEASTSVGADVRDVRGETREDSGLVANAFTRRRFAGGRQTTGGVFVMHRRPITSALRGSIGIRADDWQESDGHRRDLLNGVVVGEEKFSRHEGLALSPSGGVVWLLDERTSVHASAQHAFRRPTLNELYRPFRVGNVITEANPGLKTETVTSGEVGLKFAPGRFEFNATAFRNELNDAVANVTVGRGPATLPIIGFVPAGGEGRRRLNLDRARVQGVTLSANWQMTKALTWTAAYLLNESEVRHAAVAPQLEGLRLAQVPRHSASMGFDWKRGRWTWSTRGRFIGAQFEDDLNTLRLGAVAVVDASLGVQLNPHAEIFVSAENLSNERVETGRSTDGVVNIGTPRLLLVGLRLSR